jgi:hypothetical protein
MCQRKCVAEKSGACVSACRKKDNTAEKVFVEGTMADSCERMCELDALDKCRPVCKDVTTAWQAATTNFGPVTGHSEQSATTRPSVEKVATQSSAGANVGLVVGLVVGAAAVAGVAAVALGAFLSANAATGGAVTTGTPAMNAQTSPLYEGYTNMGTNAMHNV